MKNRLVMFESIYKCSNVIGPNNVRAICKFYWTNRRWKI